MALNVALLYMWKINFLGQIKTKHYSLPDDDYLNEPFRTNHRDSANYRLDTT